MMTLFIFRKVKDNKYAHINEKDVLIFCFLIIHSLKINEVKKSAITLVCECE